MKQYLIKVDVKEHETPTDPVSAALLGYVVVNKDKVYDLFCTDVDNEEERKKYVSEAVKEIIQNIEKG